MFLGRGVPERGNLSPRPIFTRNLGIIHWKRAFRLFRSTAGSFPPSPFNTQPQREEVMIMNPAKIVTLALQAAAAVIEEVVRKK
jgi:hypothetical protein